MATSSQRISFAQLVLDMGLADAKALGQAKKKIKAAQAEGKKLTIARACVELGILSERQAKKVQLELKRLKAGLASSGEFTDQDGEDGAATDVGAVEKPKKKKKKKSSTGVVEARPDEAKRADASDAVEAKKADESAPEEKADESAPEAKKAPEEKADESAPEAKKAPEESAEEVEARKKKKADDDEAEEKRPEESAEEFEARKQKKAEAKKKKADEAPESKKKADEEPETKLDKKAKKADDADEARADKKKKADEEPEAKLDKKAKKADDRKADDADEARADKKKKTDEPEKKKAAAKDEPKKKADEPSDSESADEKPKAKLGAAIELDSQRAAAATAVAAPPAKPLTKRRVAPGAKPRTDDAATAKTGQKSKTPLLAVAGLTALLLLGLAAGLALNDDKKPDSPQQTASAVPPPATEAQPGATEVEAPVAPRTDAPKPDKSGPKTAAEKRLDAERTMERISDKAYKLAEEGKFKEAIDHLETFPADMREQAAWKDVGAKEKKKYEGFLAEQAKFASALEAARGGDKEPLKKVILEIESEEYVHKNTGFVERFRKDARALVGDREYERIVIKAKGEALDAALADTMTDPDKDDPEAGPPIPTVAEVKTRGDEARRAEMKKKAQTAQGNLAAAQKTLNDRRAARAKVIAVEADKVIKETKKTPLKYEGKPAVVSAYDDSGFAVKVGKDEIKFGWGNAPAELAHDVKLRAIDTNNGQALFDLAIYCCRRSLFDKAKTYFDRAAQKDANLKQRIPNVAELEHLVKLFRGKNSVKPGEPSEVRWAFEADRPQELLDFTVFHDAMEKAAVGGALEVKTDGLNVSIVRVRGGWEHSASIQCQLGSTNPPPMVGIASEGALFCVVFAEKTMLVSLGSQGEALASSDVRATQGTTVKVETTQQGEKLKIKVKVGDRDAFEHELPWEDGIEFALGGRGQGPVRFDDIVVNGKLSAKWEKRTKAAAPNEVVRALNQYTARQQSGGREQVPYAFRETSAEDKTALEGINPAALELVKEGRALLEQGNLGGALDRFRKAWEKDGDYHAAAYLTSVLAALREPDMAMFKIERAIKGVEDFYEAYALRGTALLRLNRLDEARASVAKALELRPDYAPAYTAQANILIYEGKYTEALAKLELSEVLGPGDPFTIQTLGQCRALADGPAWPDRKRVTTKKYTLDTDFVAHADRLAKHLESIRARYVEAFPNLVNDKAPDRSASVLVFNAAEDYYQYSEQTTNDRAENTLGHFNPATGQLLLFLDAESEDPGALHVLYHEGMHQWAHAQGLALPFWANEGAAEYIGGTRLSEDGDIQERAICDSFLKGRLKGMLDWKKSRLRWRDIMLQSPQEFYAGNASFKYGQAWAMVHYFMESGEKITTIDGEEKPIKDIFIQYLNRFKEIGLDDSARGGSRLEYIYVDTFHQIEDIDKVEERFAEYVKTKLAKKYGVDFLE